MNDSSDPVLEERIRATYRAITTNTQYSPPPPIEPLASPVRHARRSTRALVLVGALAAVLAIVVAVVVMREAGDDDGSGKVVPPSEQPLFPDVVPHDGPELLLTLQQVPAGYRFLLATGPDAGFNGSFGGSSGSTVQYWVRLDPTGTEPQTAFSVAWGSAASSPADRIPPGMSVPVSGDTDALAPYRNQGTPITIAGHEAYSLGSAIAWEQNDQLVIVAAQTDGLFGTWPAQLTSADLEAIAGHVVRNPDGSYHLTDPPSGFKFAGQSVNLARSGFNQRKLVYTDDNDHGFSVQLTDNTEVPPGVALSSVPGTRLVAVRDQPAVLTHFLNGGDGSACSSIDVFLCSRQPGATDHTYLQWLEPDSTRVTITAYGLTDDQVLDIGRNLVATSADDWKKLTDETAAIPCALTARCGAT